jgi:hypothetical protein
MGPRDLRAAPQAQRRRAMPGREATVLSTMRAWRVRAQTEEWWLWLEHHRSLVVLEKFNIFFPNVEPNVNVPSNSFSFVAFPCVSSGGGAVPGEESLTETK